MGRDCCNCGIVVGTGGVARGSGKGVGEKEVGVAGRSGKGELWDSSGDRGVVWCVYSCTILFSHGVTRVWYWRDPNFHKQDGSFSVHGCR